MTDTVHDENRKYGKKGWPTSAEPSQTPEDEVGRENSKCVISGQFNRAAQVGDANFRNR